MSFTSKKLVAPPDLQRGVTPLAYGVQESMASLYRLQQALIDAAKNDAQSDADVQLFLQNRDIFRADWTKYEDLLQQCHTYCLDYISLLENVATQPSSAVLTFSQSILDMGTEIHADVIRMRAKHQRTYSEFLAYTSELSRGVSLSIMRRNTVPLGNAADASEHTKALSLAQLRQHATDSVTGRELIATIQDSLRRIDTALRDLVVFWKDQVDELKSITSKPNATSTAEDPAKSVERWARYDAAVLEAISSILQSLDAIVINCPLRTSRDENETPVAAREKGWRGLISVAMKVLPTKKSVFDAVIRVARRRNSTGVTG